MEQLEKKERVPALGSSYQAYHLDKYGKLKTPLTPSQKRKRKASKAQGQARKHNRI